MKATEIRPGMAVKFDNKLLVIKEFQHVTPGNLRAMVQLKLKVVPSGEILDKRIRSNDDVEVVNLDRSAMEYLYSDNTGHVFMNAETYDQNVVPNELIGDQIKYVKPNTSIVALIAEEKIVAIELPKVVDLKVVDCPPGIKGATATNVGKEALFETGLKARVPDFIKPGETVRISTETGEYLSRV